MQGHWGKLIDGESKADDDAGSDGFCMADDGARLGGVCKADVHGDGCASTIVTMGDGTDEVRAVEEVVVDGRSGATADASSGCHCDDAIWRQAWQSCSAERRGSTSNISPDNSIEQMLQRQQLPQ